MRSLFVVLTLLAALTGCGSPEAATPPPEAVSVSHKFGTTKVPPHPERVATVGWNDQDFVLALGVVPVLSRAWFDNYNDFPWVKAATGGKGVPSGGRDGIDYEAIATARPQVILAIYETIDKPTYERLTAIAPTVVQSASYKSEETPWDQQLLLTGQALGRDKEAKALLDEVYAKFEQVKAAHPIFAGKVLVEDYGPENGGHYLLGKGDPRRALFDALGFDAQKVTKEVSDENVALLDRDVLFVNGATKKQLANSPVFAKLKVVSSGRTLYTSFESNLSGALSYSGPQALLYALDLLVPQLANALENRPVADLSNA